VTTDTVDYNVSAAWATDANPPHIAYSGRTKDVGASITIAVSTQVKLQAKENHEEQEEREGNSID